MIETKINIELKDISKTILFECRSCLRLQEVPQEKDVISEPALCQECGGKNFKLIQIETVENLERTITEDFANITERNKEPKTTTNTTEKKTEKAVTK